MNCKQVQRLLPGYLDGALPSEGNSGVHAFVGRHLEQCAECREELERYHDLSSVMSRAARPAVPPDLAVRVRYAVAQARERSSWKYYAGRLRTRVHLILDNVLRPLALPATGGLLAAFVVFVVVYHVLGAGMAVGAVVNDSPTNLLQPARLESLAPFPITGLEESGHSGPHALLVDAIVNAEGRAVDYQILSGPDDPAVRRQLDQVLLFSRFRPQTFFGRPTAGHIVLSFSDIRIRG